MSLCAFQCEILLGKANPSREGSHIQSLKPQKAQSSVIIITLKIFIQTEKPFSSKRTWEIKFLLL